MILNIRKGLFETNSSSVHSLSINNKNGEINDLPKGETFLLEGEDFGWNHDTYSSHREKISYIYTYIKNRYYKPTKEQLEETKEKLDYLKSIIKEVCPNISIEESEDDYGDIDHGGDLDELWEKFVKDEKLLKMFLFCSDSILATGNDNSSFDEEEWDKHYRKNEDKGYFIFEKGN